MTVRAFLGGMLIFIGTLLVLSSFAIAYCYMTGKSYPLLPEVGRELDFVSIMDSLFPQVGIGRYVTGDVRMLVNASLLALGLLIAQGIGYGLITLGGRGLVPRS